MNVLPHDTDTVPRGKKLASIRLADPLSTAKIPNSITDEEAASSMCAGVTAFNAVSEVTKGQLGGSVLNIIGVGGVVRESNGFIESMLRLTNYNWHGTLGRRRPSTIVASGSKAAYAFALRTVKTHARIITLGVPTEPVPITVAADTRMKIKYEKKNFVDMNQGFQDMVDGKVVGRYVYSWQ
ncbi:uncharacterized protein Z518_00267 [Rhinocladiella mackenziei CBS 650.93]|uniref:Alcohol dehydrogenase-like C-terminal domain-containing protein n=1 Tax=Rhinocladiella mackenziei CBS 650.93 TaxID=1442369 RepID=A0A0D2HEU4_9EURO|nr:uncharacterized protein Z518_00267 [Rhinocladiella mackenziei CBS 650.93]KIX09188.1 hypothetical protein Z518_00267 [Rhinocladiella mackenziei CBS 650.93]